MSSPLDTDAALVPGDRVRLQGLISRSDLNGSVACVLDASTPDERETLQMQGRVKVTGLSEMGAPKSLSVKRANVVALGQAAVDWTFCDSPPLSLLQLVRAPGVCSYMLKPTRIDPRKTPPQPSRA
jgi:hypothetical protein